MSWIEKIKSSLNKTSAVIGDSFNKIFCSNKIDDEVLEDLESEMIMADMGIQTTDQFITTLRSIRDHEQIDTVKAKNILAGIISKKCIPCARSIDITQKPTIILLCGINGSGKTTVAGKIAYKYKKMGKKVLIGACDVFRAAAEDQLQKWAERAGCDIIIDHNTRDAASIAYQAVEKAYNENYDLVLIDTAGRLHNKVNLMEELAKIIRVIQKKDKQYPHYVLLVLDATIGQNSLIQATYFNQHVRINGIIINKLDNTAKGGVILSIIDKFSLPIYGVGVGEGIDDLVEFDAMEFAKRLAGIEE